MNVKVSADVTIVDNTHQVTFGDVSITTLTATEKYDREQVLDAGTEESPTVWSVVFTNAAFCWIKSSDEILVEVGSGSIPVNGVFVCKGTVESLVIKNQQDKEITVRVILTK